MEFADVVAHKLQEEPLVLGCNSLNLFFFFSSNQQMMKRPISAVGYKRPLSQHARTFMMQHTEARYRVSPDVVEPLSLHPPDQGNVNSRGDCVFFEM